MVTKAKSGEKEEKKGRVKIGKLQLNKETIKDLTSAEAKKVKGGGGGGLTKGFECSVTCNSRAVTCDPCPGPPPAIG